MGLKLKRSSKKFSVLPQENEDQRAIDVRKKILKALNNTQFKSRTIQGIEAETRINKTVIISAINKDKSLQRVVKILPFRTKEGKALLTTKNRFTKEFPFSDKFIDFFATQRTEIEDAV